MTRLSLEKIALKENEKKSFVFEGTKIETLRFQLAKDSEANVFLFFVGEIHAEVSCKAELQGENARISFKALSILSGGAQVSFSTVVEHQVRSCQSEQIYKSVLSGRAKSDWTSLVHVFPAAQKSLSRQMNKNLLLSDTAQASSRPELLIYADDVSCNHGAATGQLQPSEVFYLKSRGLSEETAKQLLMRGFAEELIEQLEPELREKWDVVLDEELKNIIRA